MAKVREYETMEEAIQAANTLYTRGVAEEEVYVLAPDEGVTDEVADRSDAEKIGMDETGLGTAVKNMFRDKGDQLRAKMEEIGLSSAEAVAYEQRLDDGKILLISKDETTVI
ncbi:general stress protein [Domibacillus sp. A3M-37]|uniref:general stress protein n=1 Tax=Domibacillus sp. A3M-37 TaxID=2962037 RepID=UPI0020B6E705|nr:general stress protein [Domibacillus sp. A3M-37]MCP3763849.1 general stress protein [Domibacillus sp. A3M-37]